MQWQNFPLSSRTKSSTANLVDVLPCQNLDGASKHADAAASTIVSVKIRYQITVHALRDHDFDLIIMAACECLMSSQCVFSI